jgi:hypothetical protein
MLVKDDPIGERLANVANEKGILLMGCVKCCYERQIGENLVEGATIGCFPYVYSTFSSNILVKL